MNLEIDFETRSRVDLKRRGVYNYAADPSTEVLLASYKVNGGPTKRWRRGEPCPDDIRAHVEAGGMISAHNAAFERLVWTHVLVPQGWPMPRIEQFRCTAATAAAMALPRSLDQLGEALGLTVKKDKDGSRLIRKFSIPRSTGKHKGEFNEPADHPEEFEAFHDYCDTDVETEAEADTRMVPLSADEQDVYVLSEIINDRGIRIDRRSARAALALADKAKAMLDREMRLVTGGYVPACSAPAKLVEWVQSQGVEMSSAQKAEIEELLELDDLPAHVRKAIELRQEAAKTSVQKLKAMLDRASPDGRVRGTNIYHGASTGRWTNVGVNFNNMPRPRKAFEGVALEPLFDAFRLEEPALLPLLYGPELGRPLHLISDAIRGFIIAAPGHDLMQADYSGIEGAVIAWSSGEDWKVEEMHRIIADPSIPDMYRQTAASIMNTTTDVVTKKHPLRQSVGKVSELACFSAETKVLTDNGVKDIVEVSLSDRLWDGEEWVKHSGVISKGVRPVVDVDGIEVTEDHLIRTGKTWTPARELASSRSTLRRALETGSESLRSLTEKSAPTAAVPTSARDVRAGASIASQRTIFAEAPVRGVGTARRRNAARRESGISAMTMSYPTTIIGDGFSTASQPALTGAITRMTEAIATTAAEALRCFGAEIGGRFSNISSRLTDGISRAWNSTGSTSTKVTSRETFDLSRARSTPETGEKRRRCNLKSSFSAKRSSTFVPVFDIAHAGPRNRFTVFSDSGAMVVHNCGFGGGVSAFYSMARNHNVNLEEIFEPTWAAASEERREKAVKRYEACFKRQDSKADVLSREAWIACELIKVGWRAANPAIAAGWRLREDAMREAVRNPGYATSALKFRYIVRHGFLWALLPSGRCLAYATPKLKDQVWARRRVDGELLDAEVMDRDVAEKMERLGEAKIEGETSQKITALGVDSTTKKWRRFALYGGLIAENDTQAVARDLLVNGIRKAEAHGYPVIAHVYDEIIAEVPRGQGNLKEFERVICELPEWAAGLPLTAGGWRGKRYRKD